MICPAEIVFWKNVPVTRHSTSTNWSYDGETRDAALWRNFYLSYGLNGDTTSHDSGALNASQLE
jgi:hypothetical protein